MKQIHLILLIYFITVKIILFFYTLETMLDCAFNFILNPRKERYLASEIKKKYI